MGAIFVIRQDKVNGCVEVKAANYLKSKELKTGDTLAGFISHSWRGRGRFKGITLQSLNLWGRCVFLIGVSLFLGLLFLSVGGLVVAWRSLGCNFDGASWRICMECAETEDPLQCISAPENVPWRVALLVQMLSCH